MLNYGFPFVLGDFCQAFRRLIVQGLSQVTAFLFFNNVIFSDPFDYTISATTLPSNNQVKTSFAEIVSFLFDTFHRYMFLQTTNRELNSPVGNILLECYPGVHFFHNF